MKPYYSDIFSMLFLLFGLFYSTTQGRTGEQEEYLPEMDTRTEKQIKEEQLFDLWMAIERQITEVHDELIFKKDYAKITQLVEFMEENLLTEPASYVIAAWRVIGCGWDDSEIWGLDFQDDRSLVVRERVYQLAINLDVDAFPFPLRAQCDILDLRKRYLLHNKREFLLIRDRKCMSQKMIYNMQKIMSYIDDTWDEEKFNPDQYIEWPEGMVWMGAVSSGSNLLGFPPERIADKDKREKFERQVNEAQVLQEKAVLQRDAKIARCGLEDFKIVKDFLMELYSMQPFATTELKAILKEHRVGEAFAKEILEAVQKAESEFPDEGFLASVPQASEPREMSIRFSPTRRIPIIFRLLEPLRRR